AQLDKRIDVEDSPVAFMTAKVQAGEIELLRGLGARAVIIKPFDPMRLAGQTRKIGEATRRSRPPAPVARTASPIRRWGHRRQRPRLAALLRYEILDTPDEAACDDITQLAARFCGTPIALISLVDQHRQWFKSRLGLDVSETPRQISFCTHTIEGEGVFEVPD